MNNISPIGHNNPPDPIDAATAPFADYIAEAENWLDGTVVETEAQLKEVDALTKAIKEALKEVTAAEKSAAAPLHDAWKAEKARWKPTIDDLTAIRDGLVACGAAFKKALADKKAAEQRAAWEAADKARREVEAKAAAAAETDIAAQREAEAARHAAIEADKAARAKTQDKVKGMRTVHRWEITSGRDVINWIARNDRDAVTAFIEEYVRKNHRTSDIAGVRTWTEKEAF